jgi:hypothetical protein
MKKINQIRRNTVKFKVLQHPDNSYSTGRNYSEE